MQVRIVTFFFILLFLNCADKSPIQGETAFQKKMNAQFKDATRSPLKKKDRRNFKGLDFFEMDSTFVVKASFERTPDEAVFKMKTTTDRLPEYVKYGIVSFELKGQTFTLSIYEDQEIIKEKGSVDYLFLPFLDDTNGETTYGGGRYINLPLQEGDTLLIDFNTAYNPYCVYNEKYSCPIVPRENYLPIRIEAGVKDFKKE